MAYTVRNIIVGAAELYVSSSDSTASGWGTGPSVPAGTANVKLKAAMDASTDFRGIGFTTDGLNLSYEPDYADIVVDQLLDSARLFKRALKVLITSNLTEATLENLLVAWGQNTSVLSSTTTDKTMNLAGGSLGDEPIERTLVALGPGPKGSSGIKTERLYHARRVLSVSTSAFAVKRSDVTMFPVSFRLLPDPSFSGAEYGIIKDRILS